jgi:3-oxoacyl-[acyl-carrier-protein] synthase II
VRPLSVTGLGVVSACGVGWDAFRAGLAGPESGFATDAAPFDLGPYPGARVAAVRGFDPAPFIGSTGLRNNDRLTKLLLVAARTSLAHAGIKSEGRWQRLGPDEVGVVGATAYGSLEAIHELNAVARTEDPRYLNPARFPNTVINSSVGYVSIWDELRALNATVVNGPTGALDAVSAASLYLSAGRARAVLVGGGEALAEPLVLGLHRAGAFARGDFALGEGAAFAVLEDAATARAAGVPALAELIGYGTAFDPREPDDDGCVIASDALARAIALALRDAAVAPAEVDAVATGLGGLPATELAERAALTAALGPAICLATPKERYGETLGASGALALASAVAWAGGAAITQARGGEPPRRARTVLVTALGIHGNASALVVRGAREDA